VLPQLRAATPKMPDPEKIAARAARFQTTVSGEKAAYDVQHHLYA